MVSQSTTTTRGQGFVEHYDRASARLLRPGVLARVGARVRPGALDRALIAGADPGATGMLAARATVLTSRRARSQLAEGLARALLAAHGPQRRWSALSRSSPALANATEIRALAELLRSDRPLYARGLAILSELLSDGCGAFYRGEPGELARMLGDARGFMLE